MTKFFIFLQFPLSIALIVFGALTYSEAKVFESRGMILPATVMSSKANRQGKLVNRDTLVSLEYEGELKELSYSHVILFDDDLFSENQKLDVLYVPGKKYVMGDNANNQKNLAYIVIMIGIFNFIYHVYKLRKS